MAFSKTIPEAFHVTLLKSKTRKASGMVLLKAILKFCTANKLFVNRIYLNTMCMTSSIKIDSLFLYV